MSQLSKKMASEAAKPRKIAVYAHLTIEDQFIVAEVRFDDMDEHWQKLPAGQERETPQYNHVRISEIMTVTCTPIKEDTIVQNAVASLDKQAADLTKDYYEQLGKVNGMKKQLLALSYDGPSQAERAQMREVVIDALCEDEGCPHYGTDHAHTVL